MRAVSVLVIACPCAMGLATPLAVISATNKLSETGIIFKNGEAIERYAYVDDFYFDKTGTITTGNMSVTDYKLSFTCSSVLNLITSAAFYSKHPASKAIAAANEELYDYEKFEETAGKGIIAEIKNTNIIIGSQKFLQENNIKFSDEYNEYIEKAVEKGNTIVCAAVNHILVGVFCISDICLAFNFSFT